MPFANFSPKATSQPSPREALHPDLLPFLMIEANGKGIITHLNSTSETQFGLSRTELVGENLSALFENDPQILSMTQQTLAYGVLMKAYDHELNMKGVESRRAHCYITPIWRIEEEQKKQRDPRPIGVLLFIDPLLGIGKAEQQESQAETIRRAGVMAAMMAHEVKNPLSGIRGAAQLMEEELIAGEKDDTLRDLNALIIREVDRISHTLSEVEFLSRDELVVKEPVNIHEVLHYVTRSLDPTLLKRVTIQQKFDPSLPEVSGDRNMLIQLFLNLLKNAAEAMEGVDAPTLSLTTSYRHDYRLRLRGKQALPIIVQVADNGSGIAPDIQRNLFDPYLTTKKGGSGLGLAIAQKITGQHEGMLELSHSEPGNTAFTVMLPVFRKK